MGKETDNLFKALLGLSDPPSLGLNNNDEPSGLYNLRSLADIGKRIERIPRSLPPVTPAPLGGLRSTLGNPAYLKPIPVAPPAPAPAPSVPDMDFIRRFVGAMTKRKVLVKDGRVMPSIDDLAIREGRRVNAAFVYSDLHGFTKLVATQPESRSFIFLDTFVEVASRLTKHYEGQVVDCAGDRVLSVFHRSPGDHSFDPVRDAVTFALFLQTAFCRVIGPSFAAGLGQLSLGIGIDYGPAVVGCVGIRNNKRIVFFGDAANNAAKLQEKAGAGETILSYKAYLRRPEYLEGANGWDLRSETIEDLSTIVRTTCVFKEDWLPKVR